ncbi:MAG TPA: RHS repeat-associated core domain-containing protein [Pyrinomonadaceae bacterium]|nr:RHS repeat-associated core domain-containing protein [Pyrinomonadaceae bacterium]
MSITTPDTAAVNTSYLGNSVTVTDPAGKARKSVTDALGRLITIYEDPSGVSYQTGYTYDVLDNLTAVTQGVQTRTFVYDSLKRLTSATNPESGTVSYTYDNNGNVLSRLDARSVTTTMAYDALNRPTSRSYNDTPQTPTVTYSYDMQSLPVGAPSFDRGYSNGRLVAITYGDGSDGTYRGYDQMGRVVRQYQRTDSVNYLVEASYYANGSIHDETYPSVLGAGDRRVVTFTNDDAGRLSSLNSSATSYAPGASVSSLGYASHNRLKSETYGNGLIHAVNYNNRLQPTEIKLGTGGAPTSVVGLTYNYGTTSNNGNLLSISCSGGGLSYTQAFGYDALNRLTTSQETNGGTSWSQTNGYDRYGNRWIDLGGGSQSLYFTAGSNRITGASYDSAGNLLNDGSHAYTFNGDNMIRTVDNLLAYVYNGEGQRVRKLVGENLRLIYGIAGELIAEFDGTSGALKKEYVYGASGLVATIEPTAVNSNGTRYSTPDYLGSPRVVTNSSAAVISRHDYMPFGEELGAGVGGRTVGMGFGVSDGMRQKFTSYERDLESGLDFAGARFYSSTHGRFTSVDPLMASAVTANPQTLNRYSYVTNSPLTLTDPSGMLAMTPGSGSSGTPHVTLFLNEQTTEPEQPVEQSQQPRPVATVTGSLTNVPMCGETVPVTVVVSQTEPPDLGLAKVNGRDSLVVGVSLTFALLTRMASL